MTALAQTPPQQALEHLLKYCHVKTYPAKSTILHVGENNNCLFFVLDGSVSVGVEDDGDGRELIYAYLNKGEFIGEVGYFIETTALAVNIKTRSQCRLAEISYSKLRQVLEQELSNHASEILFLIGKQIAGRLLMTSRNFRDLAFMDTQGRIARTLLDLCHEPDAMPHPKGVQIKITRQELSRLVGCSREVAGRILKELESKNIISSHGKSIVVFQSTTPSAKTLVDF